MMIVGNIDGGAQVNNRPEHVIGVLRVPAHDDPLFFTQRTRLFQDLIWNKDFADIMQQRSPCDVNHLGFVDVHEPRQPDGDIPHPPGVFLRTLVSQAKGARKALQRGVIRFLKRTVFLF